jgi:hypothetical protein
MRTHTTLLAVALPLAALPNAAADLIHVPADQPDVPDAVAVANAGDEIVIAPGEWDICPGMGILVDDLTVRGETGDPADGTLVELINNTFHNNIVAFVTAFNAGCP